MSELSTDALHMTSSLRVGRRVGRTIYAQLGPEPSDVDPLVATADSPVLAERIVRAVNAAAPVAREDTASPDEDGISPWATLRFDPNVRVRGNQTRTGYEDVLLGVVPRPAQTVRLVETESGLTGDGIVTAVDAEKRLIYVAVDWSRLRESNDAPAQPTEAPDAQRAAPSRDAPLVEAEEKPGGLWCVMATIAGRRTSIYAAHDKAHIRNVVRDINAAHVERLVADTGLGVLRGGGADGGREDKRVARQKKVIKLLQRMQDGHFRMARDEIIPSIEDALFGTDDGEMLNDEDATVPVGEFRRLLREEWAPAAGPAERQWAVTQFEEHDAAIARLARAAGVSPDSEDPVGAIEAAIRAGRAQVTASDEEIVAQYIDPEYLPNWQGMVADLRAGREPEVVTGRQAEELSLGSLIRSEECPHFPEHDRLRWRSHEAGWHTLAGIPAELHGPGKYTVLYRAPAPAPAPLTVGDEVETPEQLAALPEHTVLRDASFDVCERAHDRWKCFTGTDHVDLPARILDLPGGDAS